jgi:hypothetical protein
MVVRSVEQSVPPAMSGPRDFATARLSSALMHAVAAAGGGRGKKWYAGKFVEADAMPRLNLPTTPTGRGGITPALTGAEAR